MPRHAIAFAPRLLPIPEAAAYLGVSESTLRALPIPRRLLGGKRLYDRLTLDEFASALPIEGQLETDEVTRCDEAFGT